MQPLVLLAGRLAVMLWGASPVATRVAVLELSPLAVAVLGGLAVLPMLLLWRPPLPREAGLRGLLALSSLCGFVAFPALFSVGQRLTSATHGALILAALPVFTGAYAMAWERRRPSAGWWLGCALALAGEGLLIAARAPAAGGEASVTGDVVVLLSALLASLGYVAGARLGHAGYASSATTFWGVSLAALVLLPALPWLLADVDAARVSAQAWAGVAYLAVGVTLVGYVLWYWALGAGGIARVGLLQFLQPVSGVLLAAWLLDEALTAELAPASVLILGGVALARRAS